MATRTRVLSQRRVNVKEKKMNRMKTAWIVAAVLILTAAAGIAQDAAPAAGAAGPATEIKVTARKYEFEPSVITVKKGQHVKLVITAVDHDHGFKLDAFNIDQKIKKGDPAIVEFTADQAGTFPFKCSVVCGFGHGKMKGKLVVEE